MSAIKKRPTKRAPDAGDSAQISGSFLRLSIFLAGRLRRPLPQRRQRKPLGACHLEKKKGNSIYGKYNCKHCCRSNIRIDDTLCRIQLFSTKKELDRQSVVKRTKI